MRSLWLFSGILMASLLTGCASSPTTKTTALEDSYRIMDWQGKSVGTKTPDWVATVASGDSATLERDKQYAGLFVFPMIIADAKSLEGAKMLANDVDIQAQLAKQLRNRVELKVGASSVGDKDKVDQYIETVFKGLAKADVSSLRMEKSFWIKKTNFKPGTQELAPDQSFYDYYALYTIPKDVLKSLSEKAMAEANSSAPASEEEKKARANVAKALGETL